MITAELVGGPLCGERFPVPLPVAPPSLALRQARYPEGFYHEMANGSGFDGRVECLIVDHLYQRERLLPEKTAGHVEVTYRYVGLFCPGPANEGIENADQSE